MKITLKTCNFQNFRKVNILTTLYIYIQLVIRNYSALARYFGRVNRVKTIIVLPREIGQYVFAAKTINPGLLRYERSVLAEYIFPRIEQDVSFDIDHGQIPVRFVDDRL